MSNPLSTGIPIPGRTNQYFDPRDLSQTPGGTIFGTTPGGTKIVYDRTALMYIRNSPMARTPPANFNHIPGVTLGTQPAKSKSPPPKIEVEPDMGDDLPFKME
eukprot:TRINITY_DN5953_c0_g6_i1.p3 TRINITY_DN5953_c0_g6~~TRINITY_DN5953_c0_g6_i1.p3  ORF type:complete len:103 (+),score=8.92 TRINITY_DN5953_c0_g6_i1:369-677(+)